MTRAQPRYLGLAQVRSFVPVGLFWTGTLALNASTVVVLAILSHHGVEGGLPGVSAVLALSLVMAVVPGALQLRAAADAAELGRAPRVPWRFFAPICLLVLVASPLVAWGASIPLVAGILVALQLPPAITLSVFRGELIGRRRFGAAGANLLIDASVRLTAGIALGLAWGPAGVAAALVLATLAALATVWGRTDLGTIAAGRPVLASGLALAAVGLLANVDLLLAPRVLGHAGADRFDVAALPAQGIFVALFAASWVAIPGARERAQTTRQALRPVASTLMLGAGGTLALLLLRPFLGEVVGRSDPATSILIPLAIAKAMVAACAVSVNVAVARGVRGAWVAPLAATGLLAMLAVILQPGAVPLAYLVLAGEAAALLVATARMLAPGLAANPAGLNSSSTESGQTLEEWPVLAREPSRGAEPPERQAPERAEATPVEPLPGRALIGVSAALVGLCFAQAPGRLIADTKLDLALDPWGFLERATHLWDSSAAFGQVQNQAVGYLFPIGPFFGLGKASGMPMWIVQRLWLALVVVVALWGVARLARELRIGRPLHWVIAGAAYAASPFFLGQLASTSAGLLPAALVPWTVFFLVRGSRAGTPRRAAALSGLTVAAMGGVNAAATLAVLPLPAMWLITREASPRRRALTLWWLMSIALAIAWWSLPLILQNRWGFDFLPFTETAHTTEAVTSVFEALRGTAYWLSYLSLDGPWLPGGWSLVSSLPVVLASAVLAAAGIAGLSLRGISERGFLVASAALGAVLVCAGYLGSAGGALDGPVRAALDGPLAAFRNVHKFEPVLRLPLALGLAGALSALPRRRWEPAAALASAALIAVVALPMIRGELPQAGSFKRVPDHWHRLASYLREHAGVGNTLIVPAAPFGEYTWGRPLDEPLETMESGRWAVRNLVPLGGARSTSLLDAFEQRLEEGASPGLQRALQRAGIRYVVARNDLDWRRAGAPRPVQVHAALLDAGLRRVASFGPPVPEPQSSGSLLPDLGIGRTESRLPQIEVFRVRPRPPVVRALPASRAVAVSGGPASIPELVEQGVLGRADPSIDVADLDGVQRPWRWAVTDGLRRVDTDFGLVHDNTSYTLSPGERASGLVGPQRALLGSGATDGHAAVNHLVGPVERISASSYGSWLLQLPFVAPGNAFDGDNLTAWAAGTHGGSTGQWVQADYREEIDPASIEVRQLQDGPWRPRVTALSVTTEAGTLTSPVRADESLQQIAAPPGPTRWVRVGFAAVGDETPTSAAAGLREITVFARRPGLSAPVAIPPATSWIRVPQEGSQLSAATAGAALPAFSFARLRANPLDVLRRDQEPQLRRIFKTPIAGAMRITATAVPARGRRLDGLLTPPGGIHVTVTSSWNDLPGYRAANLVDGSRRTAWVAAPTRPAATRTPGAPGLRGFGASSPRRSLISPAPVETDPNPAVALRWSGERVLSSLRVVPAGSFAARPLRIRLTSPAGTRELDVPRSGELRFAPLRTNRIAVSFPSVARRYTTTGFSAEPQVRLPVGIRELDFPALRDLRLPSLLPGTRIQLPCGEGPPIILDGRRLPTALSASASALVELRSIPLRLCTQGGSVRLPPGEHRVLSRAGTPFTLTSLAMTPHHWRPLRAAAKPRPVRIVSWEDAHQTIDVGPGATAYLAIAENFNEGRHAILAGHSLQPVRLDGWQQGFELPAGTGGTVELRFAPERGYSLALLGGAGLTLCLLALALVPPGRRPDDDGPLRAGAPLRRGALFALTAGAVALISLPAVPFALGASLLARRNAPLLAWGAGLCLLAAAAIVVLDPDPHPLDGAAAFGAPAQILSAAAVGCLLASLIPPAARRSHED
jgi:arabinofuranan 3-O-arabinosyltransferase